MLLLDPESAAVAAKTPAWLRVRGEETRQVQHSFWMNGRADVEIADSR